MALSAREEWRSFWPIPLVGLIGMAGSALMTSTAGIFMPSFSARFGWDRTTFSSGLTIMILIGVLLMPVFGRIIDRVSLRPLAIIGVVTYSLAIASFGLLNGSVVQWWVFCGLLAMCGQLGSATIWTAATARLFETSRGFAIAVTLSGVGLSTASVPLLANFYLDRFGAALAYPLLALTWGGIALPAVLLGFHPGEGSGVLSRPVAADGLAYRAAITSRSFIMLCVAGALFSLITYAMVVHLVPILRANGVQASAAAAVLGLMGISAMVGRLLGGLLLDRFPPKAVGTVAFLLPILAAAILLNSGSSVLLSAIAAIAFGLANGAEIDLTSYLVARYFGMRNFAGIYAISIATAGGASAFGPVVAGMLFDHAGNYEGFLYMAMVPMALGAILIAALPPRLPAAQDLDDEQALTA